VGTGKTLITIGIAGALYQRQEVKRMLVVCPKSIVSVWSDEFKKFADFDYTLAALEGNSLKKADTLRHTAGTGLQVVVVNYESAWRLEQEIQKWRPDMIVCDESSKIKKGQQIALSTSLIHRFYQS
jgi:SNF2 family DNA or RNA helicase